MRVGATMFRPTFRPRIGKKRTEILEKTGPESIPFWSECAPKALKNRRQHRWPQLITRRSSVQIRPPQPQFPRFPWKSREFLCFPALFRAVNFLLFHKTQVLTHTGNRPHKLHIARFRLNPKTRSFRCSSSPHRTRFAGLRWGPLYSSQQHRRGYSPWYSPPDAGPGW